MFSMEDLSHGTNGSYFFDHEGQLGRPLMTRQTNTYFTLLDKIIAKSKSVHEKNIPINKFGGCGKYHKEGVPAGCGGPYILWESINCGKLLS